MINFAKPLPAGNAVRILLAPKSGATRWRLLRKPAPATFTGSDDPDAFVVYDGDEDTSIVDFHGLKNGSAYRWQLYSFVNGVWLADGTADATPAASYSEIGLHPFEVVRERIELGVKAEVAAGRLKPSAKTGKIPVLSAPPVFEQTEWPCFVVHLSEDRPEVRGIGELDAIGGLDPDSHDWTDAEGYLARVTLTIGGWSLNPDERVALRRAIRRIVVANFPVFDAAGFLQVDFSVNDLEDFESYNSPIYQAVGNFSCLAPCNVVASVDAITDVEVTANVVKPNIAAELPAASI